MIKHRIEVEKRFFGYGTHVVTIEHQLLFLRWTSRWEVLATHTAMSISNAENGCQPSRGLAKKITEHVRAFDAADMRKAIEAHVRATKCATFYAH